jgi:hypothetical protein
MSWDVTMKFSVLALRIQLLLAIQLCPRLPSPTTHPSVRPQPAPQVDGPDQGTQLCLVNVVCCFFFQSLGDPLCAPQVGSSDRCPAEYTEH